MLGAMFLVVVLFCVSQIPEAIKQTSIVYAQGNTRGAVASGLGIAVLVAMSVVLSFAAWVEICGPFKRRN